jgi:RimJ/RimL family protein N-acetyltransferase
MDHSRETVLETPRLRLRRLGSADAEALQRILDEDEGDRCADWQARRLAAIRTWIERSASEIPGPLAVERAEDHRFFGVLGFAPTDNPDEYELTWQVDPSLRGHGLLHEAAEALRDWGAGWGVERVVALVDPADQRSLELARGLGMTFERSENRFGHPFLVFALDPALI